VLEVRDGESSEWTIHPEDYGYTGFIASDLAGGDPAENARIVLDVLSGSASPAAAAATVLNAAAAIYVSGRVERFAEGVDSARKSLESGAGMKALDRLRAAYRTR
jgi:anthranilate phosphoribosyltransferase